MSKINLLKKIGGEYKQYTLARNQIIVLSRDILKHAKASIFACHRDDLPASARSLKQAEQLITKLKPLIRKNNGLDDEGSYRSALEEYAESKLYYQFLKTGAITEIKGVDIGHEIYLGAISDLTGELVRKAIAAATVRDLESVLAYKNFTQDILEQLGTFDLTSSLRNKYDQARKNLYKLEEVLYDLSLS